MDKSTIETFVNALDSAGVKNWRFRFSGGNRNGAAYNDSSRAMLGSDSIYLLETTVNQFNNKGRFNIASVPYDNVDYAFISDLTIKETLEVLDSLGFKNEDTLELIKKTGGRVDIYAGTDALAERKDENGVPIMDTQIPLRLTFGSQPETNTREKENDYTDPEYNPDEEDGE